MIHKPSNSRNSQQQNDIRMQILFISFSVILIIMFLTPFYLLATDPQAPQLTYQSIVSNKFLVSPNRDYITSDWNFTFRIKNSDNAYTYFYEFVNADMVDEDRDLVVASDEHPSFSQVPTTETDIVFKFRNAMISVAEWSENDLGGKASGKANVKISMRWKLSINGGYKPRSRYTRLNIICQGNVIEFSSEQNNSENYKVQFHHPSEDGDDDCTAHLDRMSL